MPEPKQDHLEVIAGTDLDETYYTWDSVISGVEWDEDGTWEAVMEISDRDGQILATLNNLGTGDGTITLASEGRMLLHLPAAVTAELPITRTYTNSTDPRIATWRHRGTLFFTIVLTETETDDISGMATGTLTVDQQEA